MSDIPTARPELPPQLLQRAASLVAAATQSGRRHFLGLTGPPGTGKSTLAAALQGALAGQSIVLPMDGFHLANAQLARLGLQNCKGAPDSFDAAGFVALLQRAGASYGEFGETIYAPSYERQIEEPIANAIAIEPGVPLVIVEGNYLLLDTGSWQRVADLLDQTWYMETDDLLRRQRLQTRHQRFGRSATEATAWIAQTDEPNARLIAQSRHRADHIVTVGLDLAG